MFQNMRVLSVSSSQSSLQSSQQSINITHASQLQTCTLTPHHNLLWQILKTCLHLEIIPRLLGIYLLSLCPQIRCSKKSWTTKDVHLFMGHDAARVDYHFTICISHHENRIFELTPNKNCLQLLLHPNKSLWTNCFVTMAAVVWGMKYETLTFIE